MSSNGWHGANLRALAAATIVLLSLAVARSDETAADFSLPDPDLRAEVLDSSDNESFLAVRLDTTGRLFVGGREALFVYEPDARGGYGPRQLLYRFPDHTWVNDIAIRGDDVYAITVSSLYVFRGARTKRQALVPQKLVWGMPMGHVHQCMHALAWGPEGDLYFVTGDPLWYYGDFDRPDHWGHWTWFTQPEGTRTPYNGVGSVYRVRPDGSGLKIVATGLRNACGLAFDRHWNLFTNDNDHESMPAEYVPGRLLHVTPGAYFSWPRGWMGEKTPDRRDLLHTMFDGMGRGVPVGQTYYSDPLLPPRFRNNLLVARWGVRSVMRYPLSPRGPSFSAQEFPVLVGHDEARPVGVAVGRGGRIFVTIAYMAHNEGSPVYRSDLVMISPANDPATHPFDPYDAVTAGADKLFSELASPSWQRRYDAHVEIQRRGGELLAEAARRLVREPADSPALEQLIHLAAASGKPEVAPRLVQLAGNGLPNVRLQAVRALTEFPALAPEQKWFAALLGDSNLQLQHAALVALHRYSELPEEVLRGPARSADSYLRQAAVQLIAAKGNDAQLSALAKAPDAVGRLAAALAAGERLTVPRALAAAPAGVPLAEPRGPELELADGKIDLRTLGPIGNFTVAEAWQHSPHTAEQEKLFDLLLALAQDADEAVRLQAVQFLSLLKDPRSEPVVRQVRTDSQERRLAISPIAGVRKVWLAGPLPDGGQGFDTIHGPETGPLDPGDRYPVAGGAPVAWRQVAIERMIDLAKEYPQAQIADASFYAWFRVESPRAQPLALLVGSGDGVKVWHNGRPVWTNDVARGALPYQDVVRLDLAPGSNDLLVRVRNRTGDGGMYLHYRALGEVAAVLPEPLGDKTLAERLKAAAASGGQTAVAEEFLAIDWTQAAAAGDAAEGARLFGAIGCAKCHAVSAEAAALGGPSLADAGRRFTAAYLVESVLLPGKQISPVFRATQIVTQDGRQWSGLVVGETAEQLELLLPDAKRMTIKLADIEERKLQDLSPMPQGLVKKPDELRHLLAYLLQAGK